jgi:hypothetical protein
MDTIRFLILTLACVSALMPDDSCVKIPAVRIPPQDQVEVWVQGNCTTGDSGLWLLELSCHEEDCHPTVVQVVQNECHTGSGTQSVCANYLMEPEDGFRDHGKCDPMPDNREYTVRLVVRNLDFTHTSMVRGYICLHQH